MQAFPVTSVTLDGEVVICGADGVSRFDRMSVVFGRRGSREAFLYAFDLLELDGQDLHGKRWDGRRVLLARLLTGADEGIRPCEHIEDADGAVVFRAACNMGLEGIVAKRRDSRYRSGRCRDWIKVKNIAHPAIERAMLIALSKRHGSAIRPGRENTMTSPWTASEGQLLPELLRVRGGELTEPAVAELKRILHTHRRRRRRNLVILGSVAVLGLGVALGARWLRMQTRAA
jgi:ATP-dependent DNA ligase